MTTGDNDADDETAFSEALRQRDQGDISAAIESLAKLAAKQPNRASVVGMLAGLQLSIPRQSRGILNEGSRPDPATVQGGKMGRSRHGSTSR